MAIVNPKIFESFVDPDGGEWIRITSGKYENVVWRPYDLKMEETPEGRMTFGFQVEHLNGEGFTKVPENDRGFGKMSGNIMSDLMRLEMEETQTLTDVFIPPVIAEEETKNEDSDTYSSPIILI